MSALSKLTSKGQTTIPRKVRDELALQPGDLIALEIQGDVGRLCKLEPLDVGYLRAVQTTLSEWESPEDAESYDHL
jgi:antitoxin PrlF